MGQLNSHNYKVTPPPTRFCQSWRTQNRHTNPATATAAFLPKTEKIPWVRLAIRKMDTMKILLSILWETKSLDNKKYIALSEKIDEIGKQLGGWNGQLLKQNSPAEAGT